MYSIQIFPINVVKKGFGHDRKMKKTLNKLFYSSDIARRPQNLKKKYLTLRQSLRFLSNFCGLLNISELYWDGSKSMPFPTKLYADESNFVYVQDSIIITLSEKTTFCNNLKAHQFFDII